MINIIAATIIIGLIAFGLIVHFWHERREQKIHDAWVEAQRRKSFEDKNFWKGLTNITKQVNNRKEITQC